MAKKRFSIIVAIFAGMMLLFNSCTKVSENFIIGEWEVISMQAIDYDDGGGWSEFMIPGEEITITFHSYGTYTYLYVYNGDREYDQGTWSYLEGLQQLKFNGYLFDVYRHKNKEMELRYEQPDHAEKMYLKKIK